MFSCLLVPFELIQLNLSHSRGGEAQWVARLTFNLSAVGSSPIKVPRCFIEQETLPSLLSTELVPGTDSSVISQSN